MNRTLLSAINRFKASFLPACRVGRNRVRRDVERKKWNWLSRIYDPKAKKVRGLPQTCRVGGGSGTVKLPSVWIAFWAQINTAAAVKYNMKKDSGWLNKGPWPKVERLIFADAFVDVIEIVNGWAYIRAYDTLLDPPDVSTDFFDDCLIGPFTVVTNKGGTEGPPCGNVRILNIQENHKRSRIPVDDLTYVGAK